MRRSPLAALLVVFLLPVPARADWPYSTLVTSLSGSTGPFGASIKNWGQWDQVYITVDNREQVVSRNSAQFYKYVCTNGNVCANPGLSNGYPKAVGTTITGTEALHVASGIRQDGPGPSDPVIVAIGMRQKYDTDCDNDGSTTDATEEGSLDLEAFHWRSDTGAVSLSGLISSNSGNTVDPCPNRAVSSLRAFSGNFFSCWR